MRPSKHGRDGPLFQQIHPRFAAQALPVYFELTIGPQQHRGQAIDRSANLAAAVNAAHMVVVDQARRGGNHIAQPNIVGLGAGVTDGTPPAIPPALTTC